MDDDATCAFCAIACGQDRAAQIIAESRAWIAFFPLVPATPGHTLLIPREHVRDLWRLEPHAGGELIAAVISLGRAIDAALAPEGMNLISSAGSAAEQTVFHLHLHVVPRWGSDGFGPIWPADLASSDDHLNDVAERIRRAFC
jgi:histidine triad (HIT) family protein